MRTWIYGDGYIVLWALMDEPMIEAAYGETMIHSTEAVLGDVRSGRMVRVSL